MEANPSDRLNRRLDQWLNQLEDLEAQMRPYLTYERYDVDKGLIDALDKLQDEVRVAEQQADTSHLPNEKADDFHELHKRVEELTAHL